MMGSHIKDYGQAILIVGKLSRANPFPESRANPREGLPKEPTGRVFDDDLKMAAQRQQARLETQMVIKTATVVNLAKKKEANLNG
jgi:hypothetical protein